MEATFPTTDDLFSALRSGDTERCIQILDADPTLVDATELGVTAVRTAAYAGACSVVDALVERGATLDVFDAAASGSVDRLRELLDDDADLVRAVATDGYTALHLAAWIGHDKIVELLLARGADPRAVATNGTDLEPLNSAAAGGHTVIAHLLLDRGADVDAPQHGGITPLHSAAARNDLAMVTLLLGRGADPAAVTDDGRTAADFATDPSVTALLA